MTHSPDHRFLPRAAQMAAWALVLAGGCADLTPSRGDDPDVALDAGTGSDAFGPVFDGGAGAGDMGLEPPSPGYAGIPAADADSVRTGGESETDDFASGARSCFDGEDNDLDDAIDCQDPACFPIASCCVGSGRAACCTGAEELASATFDDCADVASCVGGATTFGTPAPFVTGAGLAMGGDSLYDSGLLLSDTLDLRGERVTLEASFRDTTSCASCLDGAAFGVTAQSSLDDQDHVEPLVALQRNAGGDVRLRVGPRTIRSFPVTEGEPFTLVLRPDGVGEVSHDGSTHPFTHTVSRIVHAVAWGYSSNPSASEPEGVFLDDMAVRRARCGTAEGWRERGPVAGADAERLTAIGAATTPEGTHWLVLDDMDGLAIGTLDESGAFEAQAVEIGTIPWATEGHGWGLTHDGTDLWLTFLAEADGRPALGRARLNGDTFEPEDEPFFAPFGTIRHAQWVSDRDHELIVAELEGGVALYGRGPEVPGGDWSLLPSDLPALTEGARQPQLVRTREGVWLLHVARAAGTRWVLELFASDELVAWRSLGPVLTGSGDLEDFDALGASAPAAVIEGDALQLCYVGHGAAEQVLGSTRRWLGAGR
jgi:hypothetical protein